MLETIDITRVVGSVVTYTLIGGALTVLMIQLWRQTNRLAEAKKRIDTLTVNLTALCAGTVGTNKRIARLEQHDRDLKSRQDNIESRGQSDQSYGEAIQMVRHGATASRLIKDLGLGSHEAKLIVMLHGMKEAS